MGTGGAGILGSRDILVGYTLKDPPGVISVLANQPESSFTSIFFILKFNLMEFII